MPVSIQDLEWRRLADGLGDRTLADFARGDRVSQIREVSDLALFAIISNSVCF